MTLCCEGYMLQGLVLIIMLPLLADNFLLDSLCHMIFIIAEHF